MSNIFMVIIQRVIAKLTIIPVYSKSRNCLADLKAEPYNYLWTHRRWKKEIPQTED